MAFHDFATGFSGARIFPENRWVQMSERMPWDLIDEKYAENFEGSENGNVAVNSRVAFGALVIKHELKLSDEETVTMIRENPHYQYFLGYLEFTDVPPFDSSKMVAFRRRFPAEVLAEINEAIIRRQTKEDDSSSSSDDDPPSNHGTLILDATCVPADIHYPTDAGVLNDARVEKLSFEAFNESTTLQASCERYKARNGYYPERVLADKIYRTRKNLQYCAEHGIILNGPKLGRPPKDRRLYEAQKRMERQEAGERNAIEGKFGEAKRRYGMNWVMTRLPGTSASVIHLMTIVMNLKKSLRDLLLTFFQLWQQSLIWRPRQKYAFG